MVSRYLDIEVRDILHMDLTVGCLERQRRGFLSWVACILDPAVDDYHRHDWCPFAARRAGTRPLRRGRG